MKRYRQDQCGATAIEYGLIAAMIAIFLVGIMSTGSAVDELYEALLAITDAISGNDSGGD